MPWICHSHMLIHWYYLHLDPERHDIDGLVQDCSISSALALEILQSWRDGNSSVVVIIFYVF